MDNSQLLLPTLIIITVIFMIGFAIYNGFNPTYEDCEHPVSNPNHCYLTWNEDVNFDFENEHCKEGYYESWDSNWRFTCRTAEEATEKCMREYPSEWFIKDGNLYKREIVVQDHFLCAKKVMNGYPADMDKFIQEYEK